MRPLTLLTLSLLFAACATGRKSPEDLSEPDAEPTPPDLGDLRDRDKKPDHPPPGDHQAADLRPPLDLRPPDLRSPDLRPPPDQRPPDTGPRLLFSYDFEANSGGLVPSLDWQWGQLSFKSGFNCEPTIHAPAACHSGTRCWGTVLNDCHTPADNGADSGADLCNNTNTTDDSILLLSFQIPADYKSAKLVYWEWTDFNTPFDWAEVHVNGQAVVKSCASSYTAPTAWVKRTVDLGTSIGKPVSVGFHFMASGVMNLAGWYLDDISLGE